MYTKETLFMYSKTILFVDDVRLFLNLAVDFFRREQVNLLTASSGVEALEIVRKEKPDLVFLDLYMPGGDGDAACRQIKDDYRLKAIPVVMVTSSDTPRDMERCRQAGCDAVIHKPLTREDFLATSRKFINFPSWSGKRTKIRVPARCGTEADQLAPAVLSDISVGGVFLETDNLVPTETILHLEFPLRHQSSPIRCKGRVAWLNKPPNLRKDYAAAGMGIEFVDIRKIDLLAIQSCLKEEMQPAVS